MDLTILSQVYIIKYIPQFIIIETRIVSETRKITINKNTEAKLHFKNTLGISNDFASEASADEESIEISDHHGDHQEYFNDDEVIVLKKNIPAKKNTSPKEYICDVCGKVYATVTSIRLHMKRHDQNTWQKCDICGKSFPDGLKRHMRTHTEDKLYKCLKCPASYRQASGLHDHLEIHNTVIYKCTMCDETFTRRYALSNHKRKHKKILSTHCAKRNIKLLRKHEEVQDYICQWCETRPIFGTYTEYKSHVRMDHKKRFMCQFCSYRFISPSCLADHERIHTNERPFECIHCGNKFKTTAYLKKHIEHAHTNIKRFKCEICGKAFNASAKKSFHKKIYHKVRVETKVENN